MDAIKSILLEKFAQIPPQVMPFISIAMCIIGILLLIIFFGACVVYINSKPKPIMRRDPTKDDPKPDEKPAHVRHEDIPILSGRLGEILTLYGVLKAGPITKIFFQMLEVIKNSTYDLKWRYKLPCLMMVGPARSGKSTLLNSLNIELLSSDQSAVNSMWKLFKKGAIFELPQPDSSENQSKFWSFIADLFIFIRPRRPLDGLIITIPADMLLADNSLESAASEMFNHIFQFQHTINFRLPIYIVITKADYIPGFTDFAHLLADSAKQQIFGWSCPYAINNAFSPAWIDEAIQTIRDGIRKASIHLAGEKPISEYLSNALLFESNIQHLKQPLIKYLTAMFHAHNPEEGLLLRGIYCVGKQKEISIASSELLQPAALAPQTLSALNHSGASSNDLYFAQDLFVEKIFKEFNIAYPIKVNTLDSHQTSIRNKMILTSVACIWTVGWFVGNHSIRTKINSYYQVFLSIKTMMNQVKFLENNLTSATEQGNLNNRVRMLLNTMPVVNRWDVTSIFVPQSWFSKLHANISETLRLTFDSVVVRAMYIDLNLDTKKMISGMQQISNEPRKDLFDVRSFASFKQLQTLSGKIAQLKQISTEYNSIRNLEDRKSVIDLTSSLFKDHFPITDVMKNHVPRKQLVPPKFDMEMFRPSIESCLKDLFSQFLSDTLDGTIEKILQNISAELEQLAAATKQSKVDYSQAQIAKIYQKMYLLTEIMQNKNFAWIAGRHFSPIKEYSDLMNELASSAVISQETIKELLTTAEMQFQKYKTRLQEYNSSLTGQLLAANLTSVSEGFIKIKDELKILLDQPFIVVSANSTFTKNVLDDKVLRWDVKKLRKLAELIDKYYEFIDEMPDTINPKRADMYKVIAQKCVIPNIASALGSAEMFEEAPLGGSRKMLEASYKKQATNLEQVSAFLPKFVKFFEDLNDEELDIGLRDLLVSYYTSLLEKIDALFNTEAPYSPGEAVFDNWDGNQPPRFLDLDDSAALKDYLSSQFSRIKFLAHDLAQPIITLLTTSPIAEHVTQQKLIKKWQELIFSIEEYDAKKPGNSIAALESFLTNTLAKVDSANVDSQGDIQSIAATSGDFFLTKRSNVAKSLLSRAEIIKYDNAAAAYMKLQEFFNANLRNKFPFGNSLAEASVSDIEKFVHMFEENCATIDTVLESHVNDKGVSTQAVSFLRDVMNILPFLQTWVRHSKANDSDTAVLSFQIKLRPAPDSEAYTSSLLERHLTINETPVEDGANGVFFNGSPVSVIFGWVSSADEQPNELSSNAKLQIYQSTASMSFAGNWALFRLIEDHKMQKGIEFPNGVLVQFEVPIINKSMGNAQFTSKMIFKITPMVKDGDKMVPLTWPIFPKTCPNLHTTANATTQTNRLDVDVSFD